MKRKIDPILRVLLGLGLLAFGLNKFLGFLPPPELTEGAGQFMGAMAETGYFVSLVGLVEALAGLLLLLGAFVPLALILLAPVSVNIVLFHLFLDPANLLPGLVILVLNVYLMFAHLPAYRPLLKPKG